MFGITVDEWDEIFEKQNKSCFLCKTQKCNDGKDFHVDHDHKTGKIRGILCNLCNLGLGAFKDDIELMIKAIDYIKYHKEDEEK